LEAVQWAAIKYNVPLPDKLDLLMPNHELRSRMQLMGQIKALSLIRENPEWTFDQLFAPVVEALDCSPLAAMVFLMTHGRGVVILSQPQELIDKRAED